MKEEYNALFTPWKIGNVEIKNRIVLAPMGGTCIFGWTEPNHFDKEAACKKGSPPLMVIPDIFAFFTMSSANSSTSTTNLGFIG